MSSLIHVIGVSPTTMFPKILHTQSFVKSTDPGVISGKN